MSSLSHLNFGKSDHKAKHYILVSFCFQELIFLIIAPLFRSNKNSFLFQNPSRFPLQFLVPKLRHSGIFATIGAIN
ncbi:MAG: hypothetical protein BGO40_04440 [Chryseobacterium sp. 39-10]|nr:MAG: hypothetical protein BGO40_04440 [Chryseobacterium sp. 39-10]